MATMYFVILFVVGALKCVSGQATQSYGTGSDVAIRLEKTMADLIKRVDDLENQRQMDLREISNLKGEMDEVKIENRGLKTQLDEITNRQGSVPQSSTPDKDDTKTPIQISGNRTQHTLKEGNLTLFDADSTNRVGQVSANSKLSRLTDRVAESPAEQTAFYARLSSGVNDVVRGQVLHYDMIVTNNGEHYDKNSGVFTCAEEGTYFFSWTLFTPYNHWVDSELVRNGQSIAWIRTGDTKFFEATSTVALVKLFPGDRVWTRVLDGPTGADIVALVTSFCGFKI